MNTNQGKQPLPTIPHLVHKLQASSFFSEIAVTSRQNLTSLPLLILIPRASLKTSKRLLLIATNTVLEALHIHEKIIPVLSVTKRRE
jgi:hypothetical protein